MKPKELGFKHSGGVLLWQELGIAQVIPLDQRGVPHSYCQICVLGVEEPDPCVVCDLSWHQDEPLIFPSWDLASNAIPKLSKPSEEIPTNAADVLLSMRTPQAIYEWIMEVNGKTPPIRFWLTAVVAHWAKDRRAAIAAMDQYLGCRVGPVLLDEAARIRKVFLHQTQNSKPSGVKPPALGRTSNE
jgi:hypothetical protein